MAQSSGPSAKRALVAGRLLWGFCGACLALSACSVLQSSLLTHKGDAGVGQGGSSSKDGGSDYLNISGNGPVTPAVAAAIDERPIGGASLNGGTTGGGKYAEALAAGQLYYVDNVEGIRDLIGGDEPKVLLIAEGAYNFAASVAIKVPTCSQPCDQATPLAQQITNNCNPATGYTLDNEEYLHFGSNKTLIGLGSGATFNNAELLLSHVSNIILRNLTIQNVASNISGQGMGISMWPADHVWVDHCTVRNIGRAYINIRASQDDTDNPDLVTAMTGYVTLTHNYFDGKVEGTCGQRSQSVVPTNRNPALTFAYNWFYRSYNRNPFLMGPETWAHVFNNYWTDINYAGLAAACGAAALLQGNAFDSTNSAISINDNGSETAVCANSVWGKVYAPMDTSTDEDNLLLNGSTPTLHDQTTDGTGLTKPARISGHRFTLTVPTDPGATESYEVTLNADPSTVAAQVKASAGAGTLF